MEFEGYTDWGWDNIKDIIATGCSPDKTVVYSNSNYTKGDFLINMRNASYVCSALELACCY